MMPLFYDFGRFGEMTEEKIKTDKKLFLMFCTNMCTLIDFRINLEEIENKEVFLNNLIRKETNKNKVDFDTFLKPTGISYNYLNKEEKEQLKKLYITFENIKSFTLDYQKKYIEKCKKSLPSKISKCFDDICFIIYCHRYGNPKIDIKIFIRNIRDYFILDKKKDIFEEFRKKVLFDEIRSDMLIQYPQLKKEYYGNNTTIEKLLRFIDGDNDYNYKILRDILDKDLKKEDKDLKKEDKDEYEDDEKIKLKEE